ncbi:MAG: phosphoribosylanthranilate isomerase [Acidimicrobiales bacterium]
MPAALDRFGGANGSGEIFVKVCGITTEEDALLAVAMGADAIGFVFAPSARQVSPDVARDITRRLPAEVVTVGIFRNHSPEEVVETVKIAGLGAAQLHGQENPVQAAYVRQRVPILFQAFVAGSAEVVKAREYPADAVILDTERPGSGQLFDWALAEVPDGLRLILAGGLDPHNVAAAVTRVRPWGVDVSTGVEKSPGRKDPVRLRVFIARAKAAADDRSGNCFDDEDGSVHDPTSDGSNRSQGPVHEFQGSDPETYEGHLDRGGAR